jgi:hypothetical protein
MTTIRKVGSTYGILRTGYLPCLFEQLPEKLIIRIESFTENSQVFYFNESVVLLFSCLHIANRIWMGGGVALLPSTNRALQLSFVDGLNLHSCNGIPLLGQHSWTQTLLTPSETHSLSDKTGLFRPVRRRSCLQIVMSTACGLLETNPISRVGKVAISIRLDIWDRS